MSMATSELESSLQFPNSFSCIFLCLVPTMSCSIIRSLDSALPLNLDFEAWLRQHVKKTSKSSSLFRFVTVIGILLICRLPWEPLFRQSLPDLPGYMLSLASSYAELMYIFDSCLQIHSKINEAYSFADVF